MMKKLLEWYDKNLLTIYTLLSYFAVPTYLSFIIFDMLTPLIYSETAKAGVQFR